MTKQIIKNKKKIDEKKITNRNISTTLKESLLNIKSGQRSTLTKAMQLQFFISIGTVPFNVFNSAVSPNVFQSTNECRSR